VAPQPEMSSPIKIAAIFLPPNNLIITPKNATSYLESRCLREHICNIQSKKTKRLLIARSGEFIVATRK